MNPQSPSWLKEFIQKYSDVITTEELEKLQELSKLLEKNPTLSSKDIAQWGLLLIKLWEIYKDST